MNDHGSAEAACWQCDARRWRRGAKPAKVLAIYEDGTTALLCAKHAAHGPAHHAVLLELARIPTPDTAQTQA